MTLSLLWLVFAIAKTDGQKRSVDLAEAAACELRMKWAEEEVAECLENCGTARQILDARSREGCPKVSD